MIEAYLDESGIHDGAKVCMIAGYFGGRSQLGKLEQKWKSVLEDFDFPMKDFHTKSLVDSPNPKHQSMLKALAKAISEQRKVRPISWGIVPDDFYSLPEKQRRFLTGARMMLNGEISGTGCPNKPYFVPFQNIVRSRHRRHFCRRKGALLFRMRQAFFWLCHGIVEAIAG